MTTDTDTLIATVRRAVGPDEGRPPYPPDSIGGLALAALDSLAAELERRKRSLEAHWKRIADLSAELERVKAENAVHAKTIRLQQERTEAADVRAQKAEAEMERVKAERDNWHASNHAERQARLKAEAERDAAYDDAQADIWNEPVCSACGRNHDRDESSMCETGEVITWREWTDSAQARLDKALDLLSRLREWDIIAGPGTSEGEFTADAPYWRGEIDRCLAEIEGETPQADTDPHRLADPDGVGYSETERCNEVSPDGTMLCDREPGHDGRHVNWRGAEWGARIEGETHVSE